MSQNSTWIDPNLFGIGVKRDKLEDVLTSCQLILETNYADSNPWKVLTWLSYSLSLRKPWNYYSANVADAMKRRSGKQPIE
jgi:hypothetical protein